MIDVRELRIGNVFKTSDCEIFKVGEIYKKEDGVSFVENRVDCNGSLLYGAVEDLQPISITEELLARCGMKECDDACIIRYAYRNGKFKMNIMICDLKKYILSINDIEKGFQICNMEVKYLHQLQNIYYDVTGKELDVNTD